MKENISFMVCLFFLFTAPLPLFSQDAFLPAKGQTIYVPAYSHIYSGDRGKPFALTITLSIRNVDLKHHIKITQIDYYESQGKLLKRHLEKSIILKPLESIRYIVSQRDRSGGSGANFLVRWESSKPANPPLIESIMIGTQNQQGVSFTSRGRPLN